MTRRLLSLLFLLLPVSCALFTDPYAEPVPDEVAAATPDQINENYREVAASGEGVERWVQRFESESREIYAKRMDIVAACALEPGMDVADIGAGTGIFEKPFSDAVGADGKVYAVDIVPAFLQRIADGTAAEGITNVETVLCTEKSVELPAKCADVAFVCDVYHHFAYPRNSLASIYKALRHGGTLVIVDFQREEGQSRQWILDHVRAGREVVRQEVEAAGFTFLDEDLDLLQENYLMRFRKE